MGNRTDKRSSREDPIAAIPSCALDERGLRAQRERYRRLARTVNRLDRTPERVLVRFDERLDRELLERTIEAERACCPFFVFAFNEPERRLEIEVRGPDQLPGLEALAAAFAAGHGAPEPHTDPRGVEVVSRYARRLLSKQKQKARLAAILRGESRTVLLGAVVLNWIGAAKIAHEVLAPNRPAVALADYDLAKGFTAGTAATFGTFYLYLYVTEKPAVPLSMFGASLKMWAFVLSTILAAQGRLDPGTFLSFGATNGLVGGLLWAHIFREARAGRRADHAAA